MRRSLKEIVSALLPSSLKRALQQIKRSQRRNRLYKKRENNQVIKKESLINDLKAIGAREDDSIIVHSSLSKIGYVDGGAATAIDVLRNVIGKGGTLILPSFPGNTFSKDYLEATPSFDIRNTPSRMGIITEYFRKMDGVIRSFHPTDPVCAIGPFAEYFTQGHFGQITPYNKNSPFYRLCEKGGKILMIGVPLATCTNLHLMEDEIENFKFPVYDEKIFEVKMIDEQGKTHLMKTKVHNPEYSKKRRCDDLIPMFQKEGILIKGKIGEADAMFIDAKGMLDVMMEQYYKNGVTMYTPYGS